MVDQEGIALAADLKLGEDGAEAIDVEAGPEDEDHGVFESLA